MLEVNSLCSGYGQLKILWDASVNVSGGEFVALVGPNGAGKTTLLKTIAGLLPPRSGTIKFLGKDIAGLPTQQITRMGLSFVPEDGRLFTAMSVLENLLLGAYTVRDKRRVKSNLENVFSLFPRLDERKKQLAGTLSGGERKMLAIARGLMSNPSLLLVDEPSLGLAPKLVLSVFDALTRLRQEGVTILLVEQNVNSTLHITDRAYVLEQGRVVLEGESRNLMENDYVKKSYLGVI